MFRAATQESDARPEAHSRRVQAVQAPGGRPPPSFSSSPWLRAGGRSAARRGQTGFPPGRPASGNGGGGEGWIGRGRPRRAGRRARFSHLGGDVQRRHARLDHGGGRKARAARPKRGRGRKAAAAADSKCLPT